MRTILRAGAMSVALLLPTFVACSDDSGTNLDEETLALFVGTWVASSFELREIGGSQDDAFDLVRFGMVLTLEVDQDGSFTIRQQFPGGDVQVDQGVLEIFPQEGLVTLGFDEDSDSGAIQASYAFADGSGMLTLNLPDAGFDFDDDGEDEPARVRLVLLRS